MTIQASPFLTVSGVEPSDGRGSGAARPVFVASRGHCRPFGATFLPGGVNFAVFSRHAERVHLVLFEEGQEEPLTEIALDPTINKTGDVWHILLADLPSDLLYG